MEDYDGDLIQMKQSELKIITFANSFFIKQQPADANHEKAVEEQKRLFQHKIE